MKKGKLSKIEQNFIQKMYNENKTVVEISKFLNRSENSILLYISKLFDSTKKTVFESKKPFAKKSSWIDDKTIATDIQFQQTEQEKKNWKRSQSRPPIKKINAICRICNNTGLVNPALVLDGRYSCDKCMQNYAK